LPSSSVLIFQRWAYRRREEGREGKRGKEKVGYSAPLHSDVLALEKLPGCGRHRGGGGKKKKKRKKGKKKKRVSNRDSRAIFTSTAHFSTCTEHRKGKGRKIKEEEEREVQRVTRKTSFLLGGI